MENELEIFAKISPKQNNNGSSSSSSNSNNNSSSSRSSSREAGGVSKRQRSNRPRETEEEAIIRRFHDAQRMARFRARKKKALEDQQLQQQQQLLQIQQLEANGITVRRKGCDDSVSESESRPEAGSPETESKYSQLLAIIERIGRDVRLSYAGSRSSAERLKSGIVKARGLVRDCMLETSLNLKQ